MKSTLILAAVLCLAGCSSRQAYDNVHKEFGNKADIEAIPGHPRQFVVRTPDGTILYVTNDGINPDQTSTKSILLRPVETK